jgi:superfamily II DNA or RNA helicase
LPTGAGKTRVAAEAVVRLVLRGNGRRTALWIAQTDELCEQAVQCFRQLWVNVGEPGEDLRIVRLWGGQRNPSPPEGDEPTVVIASIQTLNCRFDSPDLAWVTQAGIIIIDECHHAITSSYTNLLRWLDVQVGSEREREREAPILGLSATPWRGYNEDESRRLAARFDRRWFPADQAGLHDKLSEMGVLANRSYRPLRYDRLITLTEREIQHVDRLGELPDSVIDRLSEDSDRNDLIIDAVVNSKAESILLFANSVAHAQYLAARLHLAGCPAAAVSGQTDRLARQYFTGRFRAGEIRVICNHSVLTTGFDAPKVDMVLISRPVFSPVRYMQMVGRGLRGPANGGTAHCEILTVEDNILNFQDRLAYHFCRRYFDA